ncbi:MAG: hypothetical protein FJ264_11805 [Planctomycetes bacterium]|nr:hypothetical protein [Planctomycetota bacterium]
MTWNYRVIRKLIKETNECIYEIHEVYYDKNGQIEGWTKESVKPSGITLAELREDIRYFLRAFREPALEEKIENGKEVLVEDESVIDINSGHYFEFMDRVSVALDYLYQFVGSHPLLKKEQELKENYSKVEELLAYLYQKSGEYWSKNG